LIGEGTEHTYGNRLLEFDTTLWIFLPVAVSTWLLDPSGYSQAVT
jgi:hypothetical protein